MKTIEEIKDEYAIELAEIFDRKFTSWAEMESTDFNYGTGVCKIYSLTQLMEIVARRFALEVAKQALYNAAGNVNPANCFGYASEDNLNHIVVMHIMDESNIPEL